MMTSGNYLRSRHYSLENFYWCTEVPLITVKQAQMIKYELENDKQFYQRYVSSKKKIEDHKDLFAYTPAYMIERELSRIIYPDFDMKTFAAPKTIWLPAEVKALKELGFKNFAEDAILDNARDKENKYKKIVNKKQFADTLYTRGYYLGTFNPKWR